MKKQKILEIFIIIQPLLDLITSLQRKFFDIPISLSIIVRGLSFLAIIFYLLFIQKNKNMRRYIILLLAFLLVYTINIYLIKDSSFLLSEIYTIIRFFYFPVLLCFFYVLKKENIFNKKLITFITIFYFGISFIAFITNTSFLSYAHKTGINGWFYSANERGNTYSMLLPLLFIFFIEDKKYIGLILLGIFTMLALGTKVGYLGVVLTLISAIIFFVINKILKKEKNYLNLIITTILLSIVLLITPILPVTKNIIYQNDEINKILEDKDTMTEEEINEKIKENDNYLIYDKNKNLIFSRREIYLEQNKEYYKNQSITNKIIGYGQEEKYIGDLKIAKKIEIDFYDIFFTFGVLGFIIYFIPFTFILYKRIKHIFKNIKVLFNSNIWFSLTSIVIALSISIFSGHIFVAPAVSIYLILIIVNLKKEIDINIKK